MKGWLVLLVLLLEHQECDGFAPHHALSLGMSRAMTTTTTTTKRWSRVDDSSDATAAAVAAASERPSSAVDDVVVVPSSAVALYVLDALTLLVFAAVGKASHASDGSIDLLATVTTAAPFLAAWFLTSPLTSVHKNTSAVVASNQSDDDDDDSKIVKDLVVTSLRQTITGWAVAIPLGCVGRGIIKGYVPPLPFVIVTMIATLVLLGTTRALFTVASYKLQKQNHRQSPS